VYGRVPGTHRDGSWRFIGETFASNHSIALIACLLSILTSFHDQYQEGYYIDVGVGPMGMAYTQHFVNGSHADTLRLSGPPILGIILLPLLIVAMRKGDTESMFINLRDTSQACHAR